MNNHRTSTASKKKLAMIEAARRLYQNDGEIEIDDNAKVSRATGNPNEGAYVQAWVWVSDDSLGQG